MCIASLDPGRDKCGFAVLKTDGTVMLQKVIASKDLEQELQGAAKGYAFSLLLIGDGTTSREAEQRIRKALPTLDLAVVDEYRTTELARKEYWKANPPKGWRRLLPVSMQVPPRPVDDFVAVILGKRYLGCLGRGN